jgi:hypothetical protein
VAVRNGIEGAWERRELRGNAKADYVVA